MEKFPSVCCKTSETNDQKEEYEVMSAYADAATYKFTLFASLVITGHWSVAGLLEKNGEVETSINIANA